MKYFNTIADNKKYSQLLIENEKDLILFISYDSEIRSKQSIDFWIGFKTQTFRTSMGDYYCHERDCRNTSIQQFMALYVEMKGVESVIDYCSASDKILGSKYSTMQNILNRGEYVRVNNLGGYSPYNDGMFVIDEMKDIVEDEQVKNFILSGEINLPMVIDKKCLVLENADRPPSNFISKIKDIIKYDDNDIQTFTTFKLKTILWDKKEYIEFFKKGFLNGLDTIAFQSTLQDIQQFNKLKELLEFLVLEMKVPLSVYIQAYCTPTIKKELETIRNESKTIKIILL